MVASGMLSFQKDLSASPSLVFHLRVITKTVLVRPCTISGSLVRPYEKTCGEIVTKHCTILETIILLIGLLGFEDDGSLLGVDFTS